jgi:hypothetical protein
LQGQWLISKLNLGKSESTDWTTMQAVGFEFNLVELESKDLITMQAVGFEFKMMDYKSCGWK